MRVAASALVDLANARGGQDNITVLLHAPGAARPATFARTAGRAVAFFVFALLILVTVGGAVAVLFAVSTAPPGGTAAPSASASPTPTESHPRRRRTRQRRRQARQPTPRGGAEFPPAITGFSPCDDQNPRRSSSRRANGKPSATATAPISTAPSMTHAMPTVAAVSGLALTWVGHDSVG